MRTPSHSRLLETIAALYDAALDDTQWPAAIRRIGEAVGGETHTLTLFTGLETGAPQAHRIIAVNEDPDYLDSYGRYYLSVNPYAPLIPKLAGTVYFSHGVIPTADAWRTEFYNDWQRPQGFDYATGTFITAQGGGFLLNFNRRKKLGPFGEEARAFLHPVIPHLQRAVALSHRLGGLTADWNAARELLDRLNLGVIFLAQDERVMFVNSAAHQALRAGRGLGVVRNRLTASQPGAAAALQRAVQGAVLTATGRGEASGGHMRVTDPKGGAPLAVTVVPLRGRSCGFAAVAQVACVAVLVALPEVTRPLPQEVLEELLGLTPAEGRLAAALARDCTLEEAANEFGVTPGTARIQLKSILHKVGVRRQAELVRRVLALPIAWLRGE